MFDFVGSIGLGFLLVGPVVAVYGAANPEKVLVEEDSKPSDAVKHGIELFGTGLVVLFVTAFLSRGFEFNVGSIFLGIAAPFLRALLARNGVSVGANTPVLNALRRRFLGKENPITSAAQRNTRAKKRERTGARAAMDMVRRARASIPKMKPPKIRNASEFGLRDKVPDVSTETAGQTLDEFIEEASKTMDDSDDDGQGRHVKASVRTDKVEAPAPAPTQDIAPKLPESQSEGTPEQLPEKSPEKSAEKSHENAIVERTPESVPIRAPIPTYVPDLSFKPTRAEIPKATYAPIEVCPHDEIGHGWIVPEVPWQQREDRIGGDYRELQNFIANMDETHGLDAMSIDLIDRKRAELGLPAYVIDHLRNRVAALDAEPADG